MNNPDLLRRRTQRRVFPSLRVSRLPLVSLSEIRRRWPRGHWDWHGCRRWESWGPHRFSLVLVVGSLYALGYLETALYTNGHEPWQPFGTLHQTAIGCLCLGGLILLNGWLLDGYLASRTNEEWSMPSWMRFLRWAAACLPVVGIATIPVWRWILANRPSWSIVASSLQPRGLIFGSPPRRSTLCFVREMLESWRRRASSSLLGMGLWVITCQITPFLTCISWLGAAKGFSPSRRIAVLTACIAFHTVSWAVTAQYSRARRQRLGTGSPWISLGLRWGPPLLLLPLPLNILGMLVFLPQTEENIEETTLAHTVLLSRARALPLVLYGAFRPRLPLGLRWLVRRASSDASMPLRLRAPGELEHRRLVYYRLKSFLLLLDGAGLSLLVVRFTGRGLGFSEIAPFLALAALGLVADLVALGKQLAAAFGHLRTASYHPWGRSLMTTQVALSAGLLMGSLVALRDARGLAALLALGMPCSVTILVFFSPLDFISGEANRLLPARLAWSALFFELSCVGVFMKGTQEAARSVFRLLTTAAALTPVWNLGLGILFGAALLHPLTWTDLVDERRPVRTRIAPALLVLSTLLPLGGLAIPFWIYTRHHLLAANKKIL